MVQKAVPIAHQQPEVRHQPEQEVTHNGIPTQRARFGQTDLRRVRVTLPSPVRSIVDSPDSDPSHIDGLTLPTPGRVSRSDDWVRSHRKPIVCADLSVILLVVLVAQFISVDVDYRINLSWPVQGLTWVFGLVVALVWPTALAVEGVWHRSALKNSSSGERRILLASLMVFAGVGIAGYLTQADAARTLLLIVAPIGIAGLVVNHWLWGRWYAEFRRTVPHEHVVVMLRDRARADALCAALREGLDARYEVNGVLVIGDQSSKARAAFLSDQGIEAVPPAQRGSAGDRAAALTDSGTVVSTAAWSLSPDSETAEAFTRPQLIAKRTLDLAVAAISLLLLAPLLLAASVTVLLADGGPVLHHQECVGRRGRVFKRWTFRCTPFGAKARPASAVVLSEGAGRVEYDVATTSVGRLLIRTGLACAPGLFNVLAGQMSVVGPKPMAPDNATAQPLLVRPGLTGHWRLEDPSDANTVIGVRDVQNLSAVNDTRTIARTLKLAVTGRLRC